MPTYLRATDSAVAEHIGDDALIENRKCFTQGHISPFWAVSRKFS